MLLSYFLPPDEFFRPYINRLLPETWGSCATHDEEDAESD